MAKMLDLSNPCLGVWVFIVLFFSLCVRQFSKQNVGKNFDLFFFCRILIFFFNIVIMRHHEQQL